VVKMKTLRTQYDLIGHDFKKNEQPTTRECRDLLYSRLDDVDLCGKEVLDLGCGYGRDSVYLASRGAHVCGIDESALQVSLSQKECPSGLFARASFESLPFCDYLFDTLFSRYALQHTAKLDPAFMEAARVLKPGGKFLFVVTHPIRHYFEKPTRNYWNQEVCTSHILNNTMTVTEPSHRIEEYLSPAILSKFTLEDFVESGDKDAEKIPGAGIYPSILLMQMRRKK